MQTHFQFSQESPFPKATFDFPEGRLARVEQFIGDAKSEFICYAARRGFNTGRISIVPIPELSDKEMRPCHQMIGEYPDLANKEYLEAVLIPELIKLKEGTLESIIFVPPQDPINEIHAYNQSIAFWEEVATCSEWLMSGCRPFRHTLPHRVTNIFDPHIKFFDDALLVSSLNPLYKDEKPGKRHTRWSPVSILGVISWSTFTRVRESEPKMTTAILRECAARLEHHYDSVLPNPIPRHPMFPPPPELATKIEEMKAVSRHFPGIQVYLGTPEQIMFAESWLRYEMLAEGFLSFSELTSGKATILLLIRMADLGLVNPEIATTLKRTTNEAERSYLKKCPYSH